MKIFFAVAAAVTLVLGIAWTLFPAPMLSSWGIEANVAAVYMGRRYGGLFFGYSLILWLARGSESSPAKTAIAAGGALVTLVMAAVSLFGVLTRVAGSGMWGAAVVEILLAVGFIGSCVARPASARKAGD